MNDRGTGFVVGIVALIAISACGGGSKSATTTPKSSAVSTVAPRPAAVVAPPGDLYDPPHPLKSAPPGTLIWAQKVDLELNPPSTVWRILYHSRSERARDIAVSGFALVPKAAAPKGGRDVYAWAHGTVGLGDKCAPSHDVREHLPPPGGQQLEHGAIVVATDYEGVGTPGVPTLSGVAEGQAVLDSVRAASALPNVGRLGSVVVGGHSLGGPAALFAAEIAPEYAPDLKLAGAFALAPGAELPALVDALAASPYKGLVLIGAAGLRATNPDLDLSSALTQSAVNDLPRVESECVDDTVGRYQTLPSSSVVTRPPSSVAALKRLFAQNSPGSKKIAVPVFIGHGAVDQQVPPELSERLRKKYCDLGVSVTRKVYAGQDHEGVIDASAEDVLAFFASRFANDPVPAGGCN